MGPSTSGYRGRLPGPRHHLYAFHLGILRAESHDRILRTCDNQRCTTPAHHLPPGLQADQRKGYGEQEDGYQSQ